MNVGSRSSGPRRVSALVAVLVAVALTCVVGAPQARAGDWIQINCKNPNGSTAPSTGWSQFVISALGTTSATTACSPKAAMSAALGDNLPEPVGSAVALEYTPPADSALVGGTLDLSLSGAGTGTDATGVAAVQEPEATSADTVLQCGAAVKRCSKEGTIYNGEFTLPNDLGGELFVTAGCGGQAGFSCVLGGSNGLYAQAVVGASDLLLQNGSTPRARGVRGTLLSSGRVTGRARVSLTATDARGPGVYRVAATIDGTTVHDAVPSRYHGRCHSIATDKTTGALMFDYQQPCPTSVATSFTVATAGLPDGDHRLQVMVTDAASDTSTVLTRTIDTFNPQLTPLPKGSLKTRFQLSWGWDKQAATLRSISARSLPADATVAVSCSGAGCPKLGPAKKPAADIASLERGLRNTRLPVGDVLTLTVSAPHHPSLAVALTARSDQRPSVAFTRPPRAHGG